MSNLQRVIDYLSENIDNQLRQCIDRKLSIDDFITKYSAQKQVFVELQRKAELDSTVQLLIDTICTLLDKVDQADTNKESSDDLIKNLGQKVKDLQNEVDLWKNKYELLKQAKDSTDDVDEWIKKWRDNPYWLKSPSDWPFGPTIDSLFGSVLNPPNYKQTNKVK